MAIARPPERDADTDQQHEEHRVAPAGDDAPQFLVAEEAEAVQRIEHAEEAAILILHAQYTRSARVDEDVVLGPLEARDIVEAELVELTMLIAHYLMLATVLLHADIAWKYGYRWIFA